MVYALLSLCISVVVFGGSWFVLRRVFKEAVLLAWAEHRALERGEPAALSAAQDALRRRLARFPGGLVGRWMRISAPRSRGTPPQEPRSP